MKNASEKQEKVRFGLLKIKLNAYGIKALTKERKEIKLRKWKELLNKVEQVVISIEKGKAILRANHTRNWKKS